MIKDNKLHFEWLMFLTTNEVVACGCIPLIAAVNQDNTYNNHDALEYFKSWISNKNPFLKPRLGPKRWLRPASWKPQFDILVTRFSFSYQYIFLYLIFISLSKLTKKNIEKKSKFFVSWFFFQGIPVGMPVGFLANGTKTVSYNGLEWT